MTSEPLRRLLGLARRAADPTDDAGLLARFAANADADAFELLVWRHGGMVLGVARRILGDDHAAEDAFQATFLALARQVKSVRRDGCVAGWLHRVARRVAMRAKLRERRTKDRLSFAEELSSNSPDDPVATASRREMSEVLDEELDRLPERFRRAVVLCYLEGRSTAEAAERLGCPRGTVLSRLATAREKLRVRLLRRGVAPAILPPVIHGGLNEAPAAMVAPTVRTVVANTAAPQVIDLCDGVIRAMILSKLKMTAAVVMTFGLIGGGAGWVALTPGGPGIALAGPQVKAGAPLADSPQEQKRRIDEQTNRMHDELAKAESQLMEREATWAKERVEFRLRLVEAEERLKRLDRELLADAGGVAARLREATDTVALRRSNLEERQKRSIKGNEDALAKAMQKELEAALQQLEKERDRYAQQQAVLAERILQARKAVVLAEEELSVCDRQTAFKRRSAQSQVEDLQDRLIQLRGGTGRADPAERKVKDLERKLDDVLRELTELRRELRK